MLKFAKRFTHTLAKQRRDPRYIFVIIISAVVYVLCHIQVRNAGLFDSIERPVFQFINAWPDRLYDLMFAVTQLGGLASLLVWVPLAWYLISRRAAITVAGAGLAGWFLAKVAKILAHRGRPGDLLTDIHLFDGEKLGGFGFPSGHSTVVAACVTVLYFQISPRYRKYLLLIVFLVGISRIYLGAHFPLDIVGGWALGALIGAGLVTIFGLSTKGISAVKLKNFLNNRGIEVAHLRFAHLDARGSRPFFITTKDGSEYFAKIFGKQELAADWLFKIVRFFRYKHLQAEEPHISGRRNVEIEAFATLWAKQNGVRVAEVRDIINYGSNWISIQEKIDAHDLASGGRILQKSLEDVWRQVAILHAARIAHRDLRASNIMIDSKGFCHIIDFGFAEISASRQRMSMDTAELLMSMSLVVGVKRTVAAAAKVLDKDALKAALPYMQKAVFSGATTKQLKSNKQLLPELKDELKKVLRISGDIAEADVIRINRRKIINLILYTVFVYIVAPQFAMFSGAIQQGHIANAWWIIPLVLASLATYILTGVIYASLSSVPLKLHQASLVQLAASFMSKIVPGGVGNMALNARYLGRAGLDALEASAVISAQAFIGFVMFTVPFGVFLLLNGTNVFKLMDLPVSQATIVWVIGIFVALILVGLAIPKLRKWVWEKLKDAADEVRNNQTPKRDLMFASVASLAVSAAYIACLYFALQTVGIAIGISVAITVYALAVIAKTAIPTPGGLGPIEAAMIGSLIGFGVSNTDAVSAVLLYRLATFWVPIPFSIIAYKIIGAKKLI